MVYTANMEKLFLPVIIGTAREGRQSGKVARFVAKLGEEIENVETQIVDPRDFKFPLDGRDGADPKYSEIVKKADGFFLVLPEYNHGYTGSLKRMLDTEYDNYKHKPVVFAGVSGGPWGGTRAIENIIPVARALGLIMTPADVHFPKVSSIFNEKGDLQDEAYVDRVKKVWQELIFLAKLLKQARLSPEDRQG